MNEDKKIDQDELLSQVKGYLSIYLMKILENEEVSGLISSILRDNTKEVFQLRHQVEELKNEVNELKAYIRNSGLNSYGNGIGIDTETSGGNNTVPSPPWWGWENLGINDLPAGSANAYNEEAQQQIQQSLQNIIRLL